MIDFKEYRPIHRWTLEGGVSARVCALELAMPDGTTNL